MRPPDGDRPAANVGAPRVRPIVYQSADRGRGSAATWTMNIVVPYISIVSPGSWTPTLKASTQASTEPATRGVPWGMPDTAAPAAWTLPTTSSDQASRGSARPGAISAVQSVAQPAAAMSYMGSHWLAE